MPGLEPVDACPVCGSRGRVPLFESRRGGMAYPTVSCSGCGTWRLAMRDPGETIAGAYSAGYLWLDEGPGGPFAGPAGFYRAQSLDDEAARDARRCGPWAGKRVLDYGAGTGDRVLRLRMRGADAVGLEPFSPAYREAEPFLIRERKALAALPDASFDAVLFNHTLAHFHDLGGELSLALAKLKPGGHVVARTPNPRSFQARWAKARWQSVDPPRMLYHFPPGALADLFARMGCAPVGIDLGFHPLHPPTLALTVFPGLDPVAKGAGLVRRGLWAAVTLACVPAALMERALGRTSVYAMYFRKA